MNFDDYQKRALLTDTFERNSAVVPVTEMAFVAKILGLAGESGEVAEKIKKIIRNNGGEMTSTDCQEIAKELGDVLWYVTVLGSYVGYDLKDIASMNLDKLSDRQKRGVLKSSGDNR